MRNKSAFRFPTSPLGGQGGVKSRSVLDAAAGVFTCPANRHLLTLSVFLLAALAFISCSEDRTTESYETHPTNWMDPYSTDWHGTAALGSRGASCGGCHTLLPTEPLLIQFDNGPESGGEVVDHAVACYTCHSYPHKEDVAVSHADRFKYSESWNTITSCQSCHGTNFAGGRSGASCNECHTQQGGPAACNTCHGLPPTLEHPLQSRNPGAHSSHARYACTECHNSVNGLDHIDILPADVAFGDAHISNANGFPATYTSPSNCATWCHSNLHQGAPIVAVSWNTGQTLNACRSCHQIPPPSPFHPTDNQCHHCHPNIDPASNYNDANQVRFLPGDTLHVNGTVNAIFPG